jgi:hypothetical protein
VFDFNKSIFFGIQQSNAYEGQDKADATTTTTVTISGAELIGDVDFSKQLHKLDELIYDVSVEASVIGAKKLNSSLPLV